MRCNRLELISTYCFRSDTNKGWKQHPIEYFTFRILNASWKKATIFQLNETPQEAV